MAYTYSRLASTTVGVGGASAITFSNIPQNYTDLVVKLSARSTRTNDAGGDDCVIKLNTISTPDKDLNGNGSAASSNTYGNAVICSNTQTANTFGNAEFYIPNYTSSSSKSVSADSVAETNATYCYSRLSAGLSANTSPVSSISLTANNGSFMQYSTATLYGIRVEL